MAVMGCVVNGPGESKHADIGISLPGTFEEPVAPVFVDGERPSDPPRRRDRADPLDHVGGRDPSGELRRAARPLRALRGPRGGTESRS